tara:strand:- start:11401 stop:11898 length:498 start_codon:yes stop_codon:yes gene_type:complete
MSWVPLKKRQMSMAGKTGVAMAVSAEGKAYNKAYKLRIILYKDLMAAMGWTHGDAVAVFMGEGAHQGQIAIEAAARGYVISRHSPTIGRISVPLPDYVPQMKASTIDTTYRIEGRRMIVDIPDFTKTHPVPLRGLTTVKTREDYDRLAEYLRRGHSEVHPKAHIR